MKISFLIITLLCISIGTGASIITPAENTSLVKEVVLQTNQFRKSGGLPALIMRDELNAIAQQHSNNMANGRVAFGHDGFEKRNARANAAIQSLHSFAENVAFGASTAKEVVGMWKKSPGHRRNMPGRYRYTGIGIAKNKQGQIYFTRVFGG